MPKGDKKATGVHIKAPATPKGGAREERLQKIIAAAGIASRRAAEDMILRGEVTVNGRVVTELGSKADPERDHIKVRGKLINPLLNAQEKRYILLNKPRGYLSSVSDPKKRPLVLDLVPAHARKGLHPVGRLDFNTEGLMILTNDGELTQLLTKAGEVPKVYHVKVKGAPSEEQVERLRRGVVLDDMRTAPAEIKLLERTKEGGNVWYEVTLRQGRNQQIRRMFDAVGHSVTKLRRVRIGHLTDRGLAPGEYRELKPSEVQEFFRPGAKTGKAKKTR
ncbi:MAG TPA: pseudouridine synthase [Blastocatellia bacterium]|nr:pseudouridine synthase [Blastocatellia bacterium]